MGLCLPVCSTRPLGSATATLCSLPRNRPSSHPGCAPMQEGRPFFGICLGLQLLFEGSDESGGGEGLGIIQGRVAQFDTAKGLPVPHIGWNTLDPRRPSGLLAGMGEDDRVYFVHSFRCGGARGGLWGLCGTCWALAMLGGVHGVKGRSNACTLMLADEPR